MTDKVIVFVNCESMEQASHLAQAVVSEGLAACVNLMPGVRSCYMWNAKLTWSEEVTCFIKTIGAHSDNFGTGFANYTATTFQRLSRLLSTMHTRDISTGLTTASSGREVSRYCSSNAWSRSAIRSSTSSIPTEMRTRPSVIPILLRCSAGTEAWVMLAGCEISVSTPPKLSAIEQRWTRSRNRLAAAREPRSKAIMAPNPDICCFASSWPGCEGSPG